MNGQTKTYKKKLRQTRRTIQTRHVGEKKEKEKYTWSWFMSLFSELVSWDLKCNGKMHHFSCHLSFEISLKNITSQEYKTSVFLLILTVKWEYIVWIYADVTVTAPLDLAKCCAQYVPGENGWGRRWERKGDNEKEALEHYHTMTLLIYFDEWMNSPYVYFL